MRPVPARLGLSIAATLLLAAACGGSAPAAPADATAAATPAAAEATDAPEVPAATPAVAGTELDACEIVTPADIEAASGATGVEPGAMAEKPTTLSPGRTTCTYEGDWGRLIVELIPEDGVNLFDAARKSYDDAADIAGIGDGAFHSAGNHRMFVVQGPVAVMTTIFVNGAEEAAVAEALAGAVVEKL